MYVSSYEESHRKFSLDERLASSHWTVMDAKDKMWSRDPHASKRLQCRVSSRPRGLPENEQVGLTFKYHNYNKEEPSEAQVTTLPHYEEPNLEFGKSENQVSYKNPFRAPDFYFEEPSMAKKPLVQHLQKSFIY